MDKRTQTIEIDADTALTLKQRAAERGVSISEMLGNLLESEAMWIAPTADEVAELDRRWMAVESGRVETVQNADVVRWLETWGTPAFKPWDDR